MSPALLALLLAVAAEGRADVSTSILVTHARGGGPVADAEVRWTSMEEIAARVGVPQPDPYDVLVRDEYFESGEPLARTDEQGRARFGRPAANGYLCIRAGALRGAARTSPGHREETRIRVFPDFPIDVEIVDPSGGQLDGLAVWLRYATNDKTFRAPATRVPLVNGRARLEHAGLLQGHIGYDRKFFVSVDGWFGTPLLAPVPTALPPESPVRITLPPSGRVALRIVDEKGRPAEALSPVWVGEPGTPAWHGTWPTGDASIARHVATGFVAPEPGDGVVRLRRVGLGERLHAKAQRNALSDPSEFAFDGPTVPGQTVEIDFPLGSGCVTIAGRVLWPDGAPLIEQPVEFLLDDGAPTPARAPRSRSYLPLPLNADGRFVLDLAPDRLRSAGRELSIVWRRSQPGLSEKRDPRWERHPLPLELTVDLDASWATGFHDLGDLVLADIPLFAAGEVVDASTGAPLADVGVRFPRNHAGIIAPEGLVKTDVRGRFELHLSTDAETLDLEFRPLDSGGLPPARVPGVRRGTRDLRVEIPRR